MTKAVRITHEKVTYPGQYLAERFGLTADDVHYIAMPLFHSNAVMACWAPALVTGAPVALREKVDGPGPDRFLTPDIEAATELVRSGALIEATKDQT